MDHIEQLQGLEFRPSSSHRWMRCPGSARLCAAFPDQETTYAAEGTAAHYLADHCLERGMDPVDYVGQEFYDHTVDSEMAHAVQAYVDYVRDLAGRDGTIISEVQVSLDDVIEGMAGTTDAVVLTYDNTLEIVDLKYGKGVQVFAEHNEQLLLYAKGAVDKFDWIYNITHVRMTVHQPRLNHVDSWVATVDEINNFAEAARQAAEAAQKKDAPFVPGETQCRFCRAKVQCRAYAQYCLEPVAGKDTTVEEFQGTRDIDSLSLNELALLVDRVAEISNWCKAVGEYARDLHAKGTRIPGHKLVAGRPGNRQWIDETEAEAQLRKKHKVGEIFVKKLVSPAQAERLVGGRKPFDLRYSDLVKQSPGRPTLVPESDPRPELGALTSDDLINVEET